MALLKNETVWFDQNQYELVEARYQSILANRFLGLKVEGKSISPNPISSEIEKAMDLIGKSLKSNTPSSVSTTDLEKRVTKLEEENLLQKSTIQEILTRLSKIEECNTLVKGSRGESDSEFDLFDEVCNEVPTNPPAIVAKKQEKPKPVAKSSLILDVKPWDDETDISVMEGQVRGINEDGLVWGASKVLPIAYGIKKLQISCVIEDEKIGTDFLEESILAFEELVQSVDIVAFNKI